jgi:hypothetical protein
VLVEGFFLELFMKKFQIARVATLDDRADRTGCHLVGEVIVTRALLSELVGAPPLEVGNGETEFSFDLIYDDGVVVHLYDRKQTVPEGDDEPYAWHIGAVDESAVDRVAELFAGVDPGTWRILTAQEAAQEDRKAFVDCV